MNNATATSAAGRPTAWRLAVMLLGCAALALGSVWVRIADSGPVAAGFWRLVLALPALALLARTSAEPLLGLPRRTMLAVAIGGLFFAADLAAWHLGIMLTRLGNATLFGNSGSVILVAYGLVSLRRWPRAAEWGAFAAAIAGSAILLGRSLEVNRATLIGDLLCVLAGVLYTGFIVLLRNARAELGSWSLLFWASLAGAPLLLGIALALGEPVWPHHWGPLLALAFLSQVLGQGLMVYSFRFFSPLVIGLALLTQPVVAVVLGWAVFHEALGGLDLVGMALVGAGLVLARSSG